jgi:hypothetical protein
MQSARVPYVVCERANCTHLRKLGLCVCEACKIQAQNLVFARAAGEQFVMCTSALQTPESCNKAGIKKVNKVHQRRRITARACVVSIVKERECFCWDCAWTYFQSWGAFRRKKRKEVNLDLTARRLQQMTVAAPFYGPGGICISIRKAVCKVIMLIYTDGVDFQLKTALRDITCV